MSKVRRLRARVEDLEGEVEQLRTQLAGWSVAALGGTKDPARLGEYGWSPAYQDVLDLRLRADDLKSGVAEANARWLDAHVAARKELLKAHGLPADAGVVCAVERTEKILRGGRDG